MTRCYTASDEERVRMQAHVRQWAHEGLLDASQRERLDAELRSDLRRTNLALRVGLAVFTSLGVAASVLLVNELFHVSAPYDSTVTPVLMAIVCVAGAELLTGRYRFYRHGVEEALAISAAVLAMIAASQIPQLFRNSQSIAAEAIGAAACFGIYRRIGLVYAAVIAMACAAAIPFAFDVDPRLQLTLAVGVLAACCTVARRRRLRFGGEFPGDEYGTLQAAAAAGIYLVLNLHAWDVLRPFAPPQAQVDIRGWFYWATYVTIWLWPAFVLRLGVGRKDRPLIDVGLLMALGTFLTNKPYLGWPRHEWDPILLGVLLVGTALGLRRWLAAGLGGLRGGFTAVRHEPIRAVQTTMNLAAVGFQPATSPAGGGSSDFQGGRSGGGGGGASF